MLILKKIISILITIILIAWLGMLFYDYYNVTNEKDWKFCLEEGTTNYSDGTVDWCKGLGYKAYRYHRTSFEVKYEFGPFWIEDRTADKE